MGYVKAKSSIKIASLFIRYRYNNSLYRSLGDYTLISSRFEEELIY